MRRILHGDVPAAETVASARVVVSDPGQSVDSVRQIGRVEKEVAHGAAAVPSSGKCTGDVGSELIVGWVADHLAIDYHGNGRAVFRDEVRILSEHPSEV